MNRGFSLVELSIVLVILGLLTGGILAGQSLIRAAQLRMVSTEFNRYLSAIHTFRDKYMALPGDMPNATLFWGEQHATLATCVVTASTTTATCNGNGDGRLYSGSTPVANNYYEDFRAWQHLANAGLIEGSFTGTQSSATAWHTTLGVNAPFSRFGNAGWWLHGTGTQLGQAGYFDGDYGNALYFGGQTTAFPSAVVLKPEEAWGIDTKLDDGKPSYGKVRAYRSHSPNCPTTNVQATAEYALTNTNIACALIFSLGV